MRQLRCKYSLQQAIHWHNEGRELERRTDIHDNVNWSQFRPDAVRNPVRANSQFFPSASVTDYKLFVPIV
jgi:hypothetical protein